MTRKLPAGTCIGHAINSVRHNIVYAFRISWPWYVVVIPLTIAVSLVLSAAAGGDLAQNQGLAFLNNMISGLLLGFAFASIAVNWHRYILLDEVPDGRGIFRLDDKVWRYFGNIILIFLILVVAGFLVGIPLGIVAALTSLAASPLFPLLLFIIIVPVAGTIALRLSVKLPAIALGRTDFSLKNAFAVTRDSNLPIFLIALFEIACVLGSLILIGLLAAALNQLSPALAIAVAYVLHFATNWLITIFSITVLTSLYGFFAEGRDF
jgi:hypothetical protein